MASILDVRPARQFMNSDVFFAFSAMGVLFRQVGSKKPRRERLAPGAPGSVRPDTASALNNAACAALPRSESPDRNTTVRAGRIDDLKARAPDGYTRARCAAPVCDPRCERRSSALQCFYSAFPVRFIARSSANAG